MPSVGYATLDIIPSMRGFQSKLSSQMAGPMGSVGKTAGGQMATGMGAGIGSKAKSAMLGPLKAVGVVGGAMMVGGFLKSSVELEKQFSKTMNVIRATTGAPQAEMQKLSDLAMKMGADTVFSANDASAAMLELARGGIAPAEIRAGALAGTLTLAAAGELEMGEAANTAVKAMGQFGLAGKDMDAIASALAGGANASSASVRDMSTALAQGGLAADAVGFSIQETTGILAAFSNAGMEGSDAGTSMKTMLDRLIPPTKKASDQFKELGLMTVDGNNAFVKANGEFESATTIAERLQNATKDLSDSERKRALSVMFGSDAQRAATILAKEGAEGLRPLIKATSDQQAAQEMANANMEGTAGSLERLGGAWETLKLKAGKGIAPMVQEGADALANLMGALSGEGVKPGGFMDAYVDYAQGAWDRMQTIWGGITSGWGNLMESVGDEMSEHAGMFDVLKNAAEKLGEFLNGPGGNFMAKWAEQSLSNIGTAFDLLGDAIHTGGNAFFMFADTVLASFPPAVEAVTDGVSNVINGFIKMAQAADLLDPTGGFGWVADELTTLRDGLEGAGDDFKKNAATMRASLREQAEQWNWTEREAARYANRLKVLPKEVKTAIRVPGMGDTIAEVGKLQRRYDMTPEEVLTFLQAKDVDWSKREVMKLQKIYDLTPRQVKTLLSAEDRATGPMQQVKGKISDLDKARANPVVDVNGSRAFGAIEGIKSALRNIPDETVWVTVNRRGGSTSSYGGSSNDRAGAADGGTVPKTGMSYADRHPYMLADGEEVISNRYGQADRNRSLLKQINANRMADGGTAGRVTTSQLPAGPVVVNVLDVNNKLIGTMHGVVDSREKGHMNALTARRVTGR